MVSWLPHYVALYCLEKLYAAPRAFSTESAVETSGLDADGLSPGGDCIVPLTTTSLEWTLTSPPPLHQFDESPIVVETEHLELHPGKDAEDVLVMQGEDVTDIIGKELHTLKSAEIYEGLIPQNEFWTEFIDEKTGEFVYIDEEGIRSEKPIEPWTP